MTFGRLFVFFIDPFPLELLDDADKALFVDKCMVGGLAAVMRHYAKANNRLVAEYLEKQQRDAMEIDGESPYDSSKETSYIFATDCTNEVTLRFDFNKRSISKYFSMENV